MDPSLTHDRSAPAGPAADGGSSGVGPWADAERIFLELADRSPADRAALLERACGGDAALRRRVAQLLADHARDDDPWDDPRPPGGPAAPLSPGTAVGRFRLVRLISAGGMGAVYEALQEQPRRTVALKVLRADLASPAAVRRFEYEAQTLARLRHPHIAQVYEAGTVERDGGATPYIAMELVAGARTLTEYAADQRLPLRRRLDLFNSVCDAVQHGHLRGVVHRDLKPANILVDDAGQPRLIDYGVARVVDWQRSAARERTAAGALIGTLQYMSPEQLSGDPDQVDARSDVFALGLILYELVSGHHPWDLTHQSWPEAARIIESVAAPPLRSAERALAGPLTLVVAQAMQRDPARRYQSAADLADDLRRCLRGEPVRVRPPGSLDHLRALLARHRVLCVASSVALLGVLLGGAAAVWQMTRAQTERNRAMLEARRSGQISEFLQRVLSVADPAVAGPDVSVRAALDRAAGEIASLRHDDPRAFADISALLGSTYHRLGVRDAAERHLHDALVARRALFGDRSVEVARTLWDLGFTAGCTPAGQVPWFDEALDIFRSAHGDRHIETARAWSYAGSARCAIGLFAESEAPLRRALALYDELGAADTLDAAYGLKHLALSLHGQGRSGEAEPLLRRAVAMHQRLLGPDHYEVAIALRNLARFLADTGRAGEADAVNTQAAAIEARRQGR